MSRSSAMQKAMDLRKTLYAYGIPEVKIHLREGRPVSGDRWDSGFFVADMSHHTVSRYGSNKTPCLSLCLNGRPSDGLGGPLSNGYGGWDLTYRILTMGYANHPGVGGPITVPALTAGRFTIPRNSARRYAWGTEYEGGLSKADWDRTLTNPRNKKQMTMREFMARSNAALEDFLEIANHAHLEHSTWTSRKIDRLGYSQASGIAEKQKYRQKDLPTIDLSNLVEQFRIGRGLVKGRTRNIWAVRVVQRALNRRTGAGLRVDGIADRQTLMAWDAWESSIPSNQKSGRPRIPDGKSVRALLGGTVNVRR